MRQPNASMNFIRSRRCNAAWVAVGSFSATQKPAKACMSKPVWPDWAIYWTLGNFSKLLATINLTKSPTFLGNFWKGVKNYHFLMKSFLGNFYRHLAIFFWSHWSKLQTSSIYLPITFLRKNLSLWFFYFSPFQIKSKARGVCFRERAIPLQFTFNQLPSFIVVVV